jgi:hypothetical protein
MQFNVEKLSLWSLTTVFVVSLVWHSGDRVVNFFAPHTSTHSVPPLAVPKTSERLQSEAPKFTPGRPESKVTKVYPEDVGGDGDSGCCDSSGPLGSPPKSKKPSTTKRWVDAGGSRSRPVYTGGDWSSWGWGPGDGALSTPLTR